MTNKINLPTNYKDSRGPEDTSKNFSTRRMYWGRAYFFGNVLLHVFNSNSSENGDAKICTPPMDSPFRGLFTGFFGSKNAPTVAGQIDFSSASMGGPIQLYIRILEYQSVT